MVKTELTISQKLLEMQKKVSKMSFEHDKSVAFGTTRYTYFSFEYLWKKISPLLLEQGLLLTFQTYDQPINSISATEMGFLAKMVLGMKILDTETGNTETFFQLASSSDKKDPNFAIGGATTYAKRYLLMNIFGIADLEKTAEEKAVEKGKGKSNEGYIWKKY